MRITEPTTIQFEPHEWADFTPASVQNLTRSTAGLLMAAEMPGELSVHSDSYDRVIPCDETLDLGATFTKRAVAAGVEYECTARLHTELGVIDEVLYTLWRPEREGFIIPWATAIRGIKGTIWPDGGSQFIPASRMLRTVPLNRTAATLKRMPRGVREPGIVRELQWKVDGTDWTPPSPDDY